MKQFLLVVLLVSAVYAAPSVENVDETKVSSAQFMNPMMMMRNPMMNPMMMNPMMMNPMMMNPMMNPMFMGGSMCGGGCSCSPCTIIWMCPPICNPCCCDNSCDDDKEKTIDDIPDMHGPESVLPNFPVLDEILQRILDRPTQQYPPDIIVHRPRNF